MCLEELLHVLGVCKVPQSQVCPVTGLLEMLSDYEKVSFKFDNLLRGDLGLSLIKTELPQRMAALHLHFLKTDIWPTSSTSTTPILPLQDT